MNEYVVIVLEIIGIISFSISGAIVAIKAHFDIFGVIVIGVITSIGGGIIRDITIGKVPPAIFSRPYIIGVSAVVSTVVFIIAYIYKRDFYNLSERTESINNLFDAIGLALFTVLGTEVSFDSGLSDNIFLSLTLGLFTGVGGSVLRDVLTSTPPCIFIKHIYAVAVIAGGGLYYLLRIFTNNELLSGVIGIIFVISIRLFATKFRWNLPKIKIEEQVGQSKGVEPDKPRK